MTTKPQRKTNQNDILMKSQPWSLSSVLIVIMAIFISWQVDYTTKLQSRITRLEDLILLANIPVEEKVVHAPHSHYNISLDENGIPLDPLKEYYMKDFKSVFQVEPIYENIYTDEANRYLDNNNVYEQEYYFDNLNDINEYVDKCIAYLDNLKHEDNYGLAVRWESVQTGFGLIAKKDFNKGDIVGLYTGEIYATHDDQETDTDYTWDYPAVSQTIPSSVTFGVDGRLKGNYLRFANHVGEEANTQTYTIPYKNRWHIFYIAVKDIKSGSNIEANYGMDYFDSRPLVI